MTIPLFRNETFAVAVVIPKKNKNDVFLRHILLSPSRFVDDKKEFGGFLDFARSYQRSLKRIRLGISLMAITGRLMAALPAWYQRWLYAHAFFLIRPFTPTTSISIFESEVQAVVSGFTKISSGGVFTIVLTPRRGSELRLNLNANLALGDHEERWQVVRSAFIRGPVIESKTQL